MKMHYYLFDGLVIDDINISDVGWYINNTNIIKYFQDLSSQSNLSPILTQYGVAKFDTS